MSTLTSASTDAEVEAAYDDASSWYEDQSVAKARAFVTAGTILLRRIATEMREGGNSIRFELAHVKAAVAEAKDFVEANAGGTGKRVTRVDFTPGRE